MLGAAAGAGFGTWEGGESACLAHSHVPSARYVAWAYLGVRAGAWSRSESTCTDPLARLLCPRRSPQRGRVAVGGRRECVSGSLSRAQSEVYGVGTSGGASDNVEPVRIDVYGPLDRPLSCTRARGAVPEENGAGMED